MKMPCPVSSKNILTDVHVALNENVHLNTLKSTKILL